MSRYVLRRPMFGTNYPLRSYYGRRKGWRWKRRMRYAAEAALPPITRYELEFTAGIQLAPLVTTGELAAGLSRR